MFFISGIDRFWIGFSATNGLDENTWQWVDQSAVEFTFWASNPGEPGPACGRMEGQPDFRWDDRPCDENPDSGYICEGIM